MDGEAAALGAGGGMFGESGLTILVRGVLSGRGGHAECGCCGSRIVPKRVRLALAKGDSFHAEICGECVLKGPAGAAKVLRRRIGAARPPGDPVLGRTGAGRSWRGWLELRAADLERTRAFPIGARQAAIRELREKR